MGKFDGILICTDLDGTLLKNDKTISKNNLDAIEKIIFDIEKGSYIFTNGLQTVRLYGNNQFVKKQAKTHKLDVYGLFKISVFLLVLWFAN